jgi:hypothetical protein
MWKAKEDEERTMAAREKVGEPEFVAFVGIDWADQKHVWCLQAANSAKRETGELEHKPEVVEAWVSELCRRSFAHWVLEFLPDDASSRHSRTRPRHQ